MRVAVVSVGDPMDRSTWSGIPTSVAAMVGVLGHEVVPVALPYPGVLDKLEAMGRARSRRCWPDRAYRYTDRLSGLLRSASRSVDAVISMTSLPLVGGPLECPSAVWVDALVPSLFDYYESYSNVPPAVRRSATERERRALRHSDLVVAASEWAALAAIKLDARPDRLLVSGFGPNLSPSEFAFNPRMRTEIKSLLFVGRDWSRKGGQLVVDAVRLLRDKGHELTLDVVSGGAPGSLESWIRVHGSLNPTVPAERQRLAELFELNDLFVMPSAAECFGCVYMEATAFGVPSVGFDTGGVSSAIVANSTGLLLEPGGGASELAACIGEVVSDRELFRGLSARCIESAAASDGWRSSVSLVLDRLETLVEAGS